MATGLTQLLKLGPKAAGVAKKVIAREEIVREAIRQGANNSTEVRSFLVRNQAPEELVQEVPKLFNRVVADVEKTTGKIARLNPSTAERLTKAAAVIEKMPEGRKKAIKTAQMLDIINEQVPVSLGAKIAFGQTMALLLNPKTIIRNIGGNLGFAVGEAATDVVAMPIDVVVSAFTGHRTATGPRLAAQTRGFVTGAKEGFEEALLGVNLQQLISRFDLPTGRTFRKGPLKHAETALNIVLRVPDRAAYRAAKEATIDGLKAARRAGTLRKSKSPNVHVPITDEEIEEFAHLVGLYRTFQDPSVLARLFSQMKRTLNIVGISKKKGIILSSGEFGAGDILIKFPYTPANLIARGVEYSPAGFLFAAKELISPAAGRLVGRRLLFNQAQFVRANARGIVGTTTLYALGAHLESMGILTGERERDRDIADLKRQTGFGEYRLNVSALKRYIGSGMEARFAAPRKDDWTVSYDWFQPFAVAISMGANASQNQARKGHAVALSEALAAGDALMSAAVIGREAAGTLGAGLLAVESGLQTVAEQPLISNLTRAFRYKEITNTLGYVVSQVPSSFTPTLLSQFKQLVDNTSRNTYDPSPVMVAFNRVVNKLPGVSRALPPRVSSFGETKKISKERIELGEAIETGQYGPFLLTVLDVFFNPAFVNRIETTPEGQMVLDIYESTGEGRHAPRLISKKQRVKGFSVELDGRTMSQMQKYVGTRTRDVYRLLSNSRRFSQKTSDDQIGEMVSWMNAIGKASKVEFLGQRVKGSEIRSRRTGRRTKTGIILFNLPLTDEELELE